MSELEWRLDGIDVSVWQGSIDWTRVAATPIEVAIVKMTEGATFRDPTFSRNYVGARAGELPFVGVYHFVGHGRADAQLHAIEAAIGDVIDPSLELPSGTFLALDYESTGDSGIPDLGIFLDLLELTESRWPGRVAWYTYTSLARQIVDRVPIGRPLWLADYTSSAPRAIDELGAFLWQYSSSAHIDGINSRVDANRIVIRGELEHLTATHEDDEMSKPIHRITTGVAGEAEFVRFGSGLVRHYGGGESAQYVSLPVVVEADREAVWRLVVESGTTWRPADFPSEITNITYGLEGELKIRG